MASLLAIMGIWIFCQKQYKMIIMAVLVLDRVACVVFSLKK